MDNDDVEDTSPSIPQLLRILVLLRGHRVEYLEKLVAEKYGGNITSDNLDQFLEEVMKN